jgi:cytidine deaminase
MEMEQLLKEAINEALFWRSMCKERYLADMSKVRVGACVIARNMLNHQERKLFSACNIEVSKTYRIHAEQLATWEALQSGFTMIDVIVVTSQSEEECAALCDNCRGFFSKINPHLRVVVVNPDGSMKLDLWLDKDLRPYAYNG